MSTEKTEETQRSYLPKFTHQECGTHRTGPQALQSQLSAFPGFTRACRTGQGEPGKTTLYTGDKLAQWSSEATASLGVLLLPQL